MQAVKCPYCCRDNTIDCRATQEIILVCLHCDNTFAALVEVSIDITASKLCGVNGIDHKLLAADAEAPGVVKPPYSVCGECRDIVFNTDKELKTHAR